MCPGGRACLAGPGAGAGAAHDGDVGGRHLVDVGVVGPGEGEGGGSGPAGLHPLHRQPDVVAAALLTPHHGQDHHCPAEQGEAPAGPHVRFGPALLPARPAVM